MSNEIVQPYHILSIVDRCINPIKNTNIDDALAQIITNFREIRLEEKVPNFRPCDKKLYVTHSKIRVRFRDCFYSLEQFFKEGGYNGIDSPVYECGYQKFIPIYDNYNVNLIENTIEICVDILVKKQRGTFR